VVKVLGALVKQGQGPLRGDQHTLVAATGVGEKVADVERERVEVEVTHRLLDFVASIPNRGSVV